MGLGSRGIVLSKIVQILNFLIISVVKTKAADLHLCFPIDKRQVFSWRGFLAHLSRRLIGELIGYSWSGVRPASLSFTKLKDLPLQNRLANQSQIYVEPPWVGGTKVCLRHLGHMTKMAAMPIYGKNP